MAIETNEPQKTLLLNASAEHVTLTVRQWIKRDNSQIVLREKAVSFLFWAYGGLLVATGVIIFLQGFGCCNFKLPESFLHWLGAATVGEVGGLLTLVYGALFKKDGA